jgi:hypothetical protein
MGESGLIRQFLFSTLFSKNKEVLADMDRTTAAPTQGTIPTTPRSKAAPLQRGPFPVLSFFQILF